MQTKKQRKRERMAKLCASIGGENTQIVKQLRATNRRIEKQKRAQKQHGI